MAPPLAAAAARAPLPSVGRRRAALSLRPPRRRRQLVPVVGVAAATAAVVVVVVVAAAWGTAAPAAAVGVRHRPHGQLRTVRQGGAPDEGGGDAAAEAPAAEVAAVSPPATTAAASAAPHDAAAAHATPVDAASPGGNKTHSAHAVIDALDLTYVDHDGDGEAAVTLSGVGSHTHHFADDGSPGTLTRTEWFNNDTGALLGSALRVTATFPLGTTTVRLEVADSAGAVASDWAVVAVVDAIRPGAYCYYFPPGTAFPPPADGAGAPKAVFAAPSGMQFIGTRTFPEGPHGDGDWVARCVWLYHAAAAGDYTFGVNVTGRAALRVDAKTVFDDGEEAGTVTLAAGLHEAVLAYAKVGPDAHLRVTVNGDDMPDGAFSHDQNRVVPVITGISPAAGGTVGGTAVRVTGVGFFTSSVRVVFGAAPAASVDRVSATELRVVAPPASPGPHAVTVVTGGGGADDDGSGDNVAGDGREAAPAEGGVSNAVTFTVAGDAVAPEFTSFLVKGATGDEKFDLPSGIAIAYGPDGRYYVSLYGPHVLALTISGDGLDHRVTDVCKSESLGVNVSAASVSFNPADGDNLQAYVSVATLYYHERYGLPMSAWDNGRILLLAPDDDRGECLGIKSTVISGLPTSNHDHSPAGLAWDPDGRLLILSPGLTNMGTAAGGERLGGTDESPLSAAVLIADVNAPGFDGAITYNSTAEERYAVQTGGFDVAIYATGLRSAFGSTVHTSGELYVTDNGPNELFGDEVFDGCDSSRASTGHGDKVVRLVRGAHYGHPNPNRGRDDPAQCTYKWPNEAETADYKPPLVAFADGSHDGIVEVLSNVFPAMKHDVLVSKFSTGNRANDGLLKLIHLSDAGADDPPTVTDVHPASGLDIESTPSGAYYLPRTQKGELLAIVPVYDPPPADGPPLPLGVKPHRGPAAGGHTVTVGGHNFGAAPTATLGDRPCTDVRDVAPDGTRFRCTVPPAAVAGALVRLAVTAGETGVTSDVTPGRGDYWYMNDVAVAGVDRASCVVGGGRGTCKVRQ
ncbi:hypothetical protein BU14_0229s0001 [Porphyra umbilicalis]|uniref:IPT/TIG domain-containing protein n=1 Tax=Porphyra umbilicalis TaxID=2786 RepID=A0A1X6P4N8_PORUM|nr:hypothetical protein BU14_0229s0001 [Porphyra umbilicalis]|eukprot:OSX75613.1 hypothetical protein BU14_0229s0001 [Porphyra umbilicalis]